MNASTITGSEAKRRKTYPPLNRKVSISDLPNQLLGQVAEYLVAPSRAILAAAISTRRSVQMTSDAHLQPLSLASLAVLPLLQLSEIDFAEVDKDLAEKVTDDDLAEMFACIKARDNLKRLKITGCKNITGRGLEILRGSMVLEQIDLRVISSKDNSCLFWADEADQIRQSRGNISEDIALPILQSIVRKDGNALRLIQLPKGWLRERSHLLDQLLMEYEQLLMSRREPCHKCGIQMVLPPINRRANSSHYGYQPSTCFKCLNHFCRSQRHILGQLRCQEVEQCKNCEKNFCKDCALWCKNCSQCSGCALSTRTQCVLGCEGLCCEECIKTCLHCDGTGCQRCLGFRQCRVCNEAHCVTCFDNLPHDCNVQICGMCEDESCSDCFADDYCDDDCTHRDCLDCIQRFVQIARSLHSEVERLNEENEELRANASARQNGDLNEAL